MPGPAAGSHPAKLLIVDDLPENLRALEALIRQDDRLIYQARSGDEALALLLDHEFALAILDVQMPAMNGFELAALMRGTERTRAIPIIFVTAAGRELNYAFHGYENGAVDFLYKPLDVYAVRSKVSVLVSLYCQRKEIERQVEALDAGRGQQELLVRELLATQTELRRAVQMRDEFMSMVAHELRTPLNTLFIDSQTRKSQADRDNVGFFTLERVKEMVGRDARQIRSMVRLITDMLDVSRIDGGKLTIEPADCDLAQIVRRVAADLSQQAEAAGSPIVVHADEPVPGHWDAFRIEQILVNLLGNALRYGRGKPVSISLAVTPQDGARIVVGDQGPGIALEDRQRVFEKFERAQTENAAGGLGLGLFITKQLVEAHHGRVVVQSQPGEGASFIVTLPMAPTSS
ncbi:MAG: hybrid sensor histidine kinase/response regulator [Pseudomonadota bacterium]|nr:hybrid sensor histidine kinase/response regulator [Pseudomonadota bacterium]